MHVQPKMFLHLLISLTFCLASGFEYIVNYDRLELAYHDRNLVAKDAYFLFRKYNRTNHYLNVSFDLLKDLDGNDMQFTTQFYRFLSNEYKYLGLKLHFNVCKYWNKNIYGTTKHLSQFGNLEGCDIKKGHYYLYNYMPDESNFPKYLPIGSYMLQMDVVWNSQIPLLKFQWFMTAIFKIKGRQNRS